MALTWKHAWAARNTRSIQNIQDPNYFDLEQNKGIFTIQYPHETVPIPVNGRYQLHNEMDDCIVCDKCVKVCPVDCIEIEPIKATGLVGHTSDGSPIRLYAAKFDIDMSKCCFCGLCTTVCPTECLTMTSEYDFSVFDVKDHNFSFANLSPEEAVEKKQLYEQFVAEKEALKAANKENELKMNSDDRDIGTQEPLPVPSKPAFKPSFKAKLPEIKTSENSSVEHTVKSNTTSESNDEIRVDLKRPFVAEIKADLPAQSVDEIKTNAVVETPELKPVFKPSFKAKLPPKPTTENE